MLAQLKSLIENECICTQAELSDRLYATTLTRVSPSTICRALRAIGFSNKKLTHYCSHRRLEHFSLWKDTMRNLAHLYGGREQLFRRLVFVDESMCARRAGRRERGYSPIGQRAVYFSATIGGTRHNICGAV